MIPKRPLLTLIFACLCFKKSLLINDNNDNNNNNNKNNNDDDDDDDVVTKYVILQLMCPVRDAQCNEDVSSLFAIYYFFRCLRCILHRTAETHSVDCRSSNFCQGNIENIPYVPSPLPSRSVFPFSFPIYYSLQDDLFQVITSFQMAKILQILFLYKGL